MPNAWIDEDGGWIGPKPPPVNPARQAVQVTHPGPTQMHSWAPGTAQVGGVQPNYEELIQNDPTYAAWKASATGRRSNLATMRAAAIRALLLKHGGLPPGFSDAYGDINPADIQAAGGNPFSEEGGIQRAYTQGVDAMRRQLAARGALGSGELGYGQEQADYSRAAAEYGSNQGFMDSINSALNDYLGGMGSISSEEPGAIDAARQFVYDHYKPTAAHEATLVPGWEKQYGFPVYVDSDGQQWRYDPATGAPTKFTGTAR